MTDPVPEATRTRRSSALIWLPLIVLGLLIGLGAYALTRPAETTVHSAMVGKALPAFDLPAAFPDRPSVPPAAAEGPRIVNLFASWCVPCRAEAPQLETLAKEGVPIDGIAIHDRPEALAAFLDQAGDPYQNVADDQEGRSQIALGSSGVPESYIVDGRGIIRYQQIGPIMPQDLPTIRAELAKAR